MEENRRKKQKETELTFSNSMKAYCSDSPDFWSLITSQLQKIQQIPEKKRTWENQLKKSQFWLIRVLMAKTNCWTTRHVVKHLFHWYMLYSIVSWGTVDWSHHKFALLRVNSLKVLADSLLFYAFQSLVFLGLYPIILAWERSCDPDCKGPIMVVYDTKTEKRCFTF